MTSTQPFGRKDFGANLTQTNFSNALLTNKSPGIAQSTATSHMMAGHKSTSFKVNNALQTSHNKQLMPIKAHNFSSTSHSHHNHHHSAVQSYATGSLIQGPQKLMAAKLAM